MENQNINFENYLGHILQLHPKWKTFTLDAADVERDSFSRLRNEEKLTWFPADFQSEVRSLFENHNNCESISHKIALGVYNLQISTGALYAELESRLQLAFGKQLSKSYFSKLRSAGELFTKNPELLNVKDIEKASIISRVKNEDDLKEIIEQNNLASMSRGSLKKVVDEKLGVVRPIIDSKLKELQIKVGKDLIKLTYEKLGQVDQLVTSLLDKPDDSTLKAA